MYKDREFKFETVNGDVNHRSMGTIQAKRFTLVTTKIESRGSYLLAKISSRYLR